ncbi:MAG: ATP-binding protein [Rubrobacteridae bacterium]|nr:ATP-binding protein [Rubrobacteridae bacterium]
MISKRLKVILPSKPESLEEIRREISGFVTDTVFNDRVKDILLVTSEAGTNVVRHAYNGKRGRHFITIECVLRDEDLTILVCDKGRGLSKEKKQTMFTQEGGFGLFLMRELTDKFKCHSSRFGTVIELGFMHEYEEKDIVKNRAITGSVTLTSPRAVRSYAKIKAFTLFVTDQTKELNDVLKSKDYDLANAMLLEVLEQLMMINRYYCRLTPKTQSVVKKWLEENIEILRTLEQSLLRNESNSIRNSSGVYCMIRQRETINMLIEIATGLEAMVSDKNSCWIALDDEPLQLI